MIKISCRKLFQSFSTFCFTYFNRFFIFFSFLSLYKNFFKLLPALPLILCVVYLNQHSGAVHSKRWTKYAFSCFYVIVIIGLFTYDIQLILYTLILLFYLILPHFFISCFFMFVVSYWSIWIDSKWYGTLLVVFTDNSAYHSCLFSWECRYKICAKNMKKAYLDRCLDCAVNKHWSKYTKLVYRFNNSVLQSWNWFKFGLVCA